MRKYISTKREGSIFMDISITYTYQRGGNAKDSRVYNNISHHHVICYPRMYELGALVLCYLNRLEKAHINISPKVDLLAGINSLTAARVMSAVHAVISQDNTGKAAYHLPSDCSDIHACLSEIAWLPMNLFTGPKGNFRSDDPGQGLESFPPNMPYNQRAAIKNIIKEISRCCTSYIPNVSGASGTVRFSKENFNCLMDIFFNNIDIHLRCYDSKVKDWVIGTNYKLGKDGWHYTTNYFYYPIHFYQKRQRERLMPASFINKTQILGQFAVKGSQPLVPQMKFGVLDLGKDCVKGVVKNLDSSDSKQQDMTIKSLLG